MQVIQHLRVVRQTTHLHRHPVALLDVDLVDHGAAGLPSPLVGVLAEEGEAEAVVGEKCDFEAQPERLYADLSE